MHHQRRPQAGDCEPACSCRLPRAMPEACRAIVRHLGSYELCPPACIRMCVKNLYLIQGCLFHTHTECPTTQPSSQGARARWCHALRLRSRQEIELWLLYAPNDFITGIPIWHFPARPPRKPFFRGPCPRDIPTRADTPHQANALHKVLRAEG